MTSSLKINKKTLNTIGNIILIFHAEYKTKNQAFSVLYSNKTYLEISRLANNFLQQKTNLFKLMTQNRVVTGLNGKYK